MSVVASGASPLGTSARCDGSGRGSSVAGGDACSCAVSAGVLAGEGDAAAVAAVAPEGGAQKSPCVALVQSEIMEILALPMPQAPEATPPGSAGEELPS